ncbi:MAG: roadblock/LC7 protein [Gammaproteobacteria bacterium]|nr:roadblock/LC7 protein [Gammaproteobacteria bacterium]
MQTTNQRFAVHLVDATRRQLAEFVAANTEITLALVTSADGFEVAAHPDQPMAQRIAAMSSSLQALSEAIAREAGLSRSRNLIIESDGGTIVVLGIPDTSPRLSLAVVASGNEILGRLLWATRSCCAALGRSLQV